VSIHPHEAALFALIAMALTVTGWAIGSPVLSMGERGSVLAAAAGALLAVGWRIRRDRT